MVESDMNEINVDDCADQKRFYHRSDYCYPR